MGKEELERLERAYEEYRREYQNWTACKPPKWRFIRYKKWLKDEPKLRV